MIPSDLACHAGYSKHFYFRSRCQHDRWTVWIPAVQFDVVGRDLEHLAGRNDDVPIQRSHRAINDQDVAVANASVQDAPALGALQKGRRRIADQHPAEVDLIVLEVLGG